MRCAQGLTILEEVPRVLHGFLHIAQLRWEGGHRGRLSVCLSVWLYTSHHSPCTLHKQGGRKCSPARSLPCSVPPPPSAGPPTSTLGHTTTAPGCRLRDLGSGRGSARGGAREGEG